MNIEQIIKETLDGTFTRVMTDNRVITINVADDYIPKHNTVGMVIGEKCGQYTQYSTKEDAILLELRGMGFPFHKIGAHLSRSEESVKKRYAVVRVMGGTRSKSA